MAAFGAGARWLKVGGVAAPRGYQVRVRVLVVPTGTEQVAQQPVRPSGAAEDAGAQRPRRAFSAGPATAIAASSSSSTLSQTFPAMYSMVALNWPVTCMVLTTWL